MLYSELSIGKQVKYVHTGRAMTVCAMNDGLQLVTCRFIDDDSKTVEVQMPPQFLQPLPIEPVSSNVTVEEWHETERERQADGEKNNT